MVEPTHWWKVTMLFPLFDNDGNPFAEAIWRWWRIEITRLARGFTDTGVVTGWWQGMSDQNRSVVIIVKTEREIDALRRFLVRARKKFRQRAMYFDYHPTHFEEVQ